MRIGRAKQPALWGKLPNSPKHEDGPGMAGSKGLELSRQITVDLEPDADFDEGRGGPRHGRFLRYGPSRAAVAIAIPHAANRGNGDSYLIRPIV